MKKNSKKNKLKWYDNASFIKNLIIVVISIFIVSTQSLANGEFSFALFSSVINHNSVYILVLLYFILLNFSIGKKFFNYMNVILVFIYFITTAMSLFTIVQSFSLYTVLSFIIHFVLLVYMSHTLFRDSRIWKEFSFSKSPFNELTNDWYFSVIVILSIFLLSVNLISTVVISGVIVSILDFMYFILLGRYLYLYRDYLDKRKLDINNEGNFDDVREKVQKVLDKTDIDDKIVKGVKDIHDKIDDFVSTTEIDKKIDNVKEKFLDVSSNISDKVSDAVNSSSNSEKKEKLSKIIKKEDE